MAASRLFRHPRFVSGVFLAANLVSQAAILTYLKKSPKSSGGGKMFKPAEGKEHKSEAPTTTATPTPPQPTQAKPK